MDKSTEIYKSDEIQKELYEIYEQYHNSIKVFIGQLETLQNKFPVELLNEIRAVFSHIAKIYVDCDEKTAKINLQKAKNHIKRAQLDSYKYMCYAYSKFYIDFKRLYKNVDLSYVNNGAFITELSDTYVDATQKAQEARYVEGKADDVIEAYGHYEDAYIAYAKVFKLIKDNSIVIERLQQKEVLLQNEFNEKMSALQQSNIELNEKLTVLQKENEEEKQKSKRVTIVSIVLGVASVILGALAFL